MIDLIVTRASEASWYEEGPDRDSFESPCRGVKLARIGGGWGWVARNVGPEWLAELMKETGCDVLLSDELPGWMDGDMPVGMLHAIIVDQHLY